VASIVPDLSPIEHLWKYLKKCLNSYERLAKGVWKRWKRIEAEWGKIEVEQCQKLIEVCLEDLRQRYTEIQANGGHTKY
jgi:hypothetical protein